MSLTLGEKLRQAREERGISVSEVAEQTRISPLYIDSIENDNYKPLPGGIFNKGFVKSYAKYVGVDEHEALQDYAKIAASMEAEAAEPPRSYRPEVLTDDRPGISILPTVLIAGVILAIMTVLILFVMRYLSAPETSETAANTSANTQQTVAVATPETQSPTASAPSIGTSKIEFRAVGQPVWLRAVVDGKSSETLIDADKSATFEPKESLRLSYSRSRAQFASLAIDGKQVKLPAEPASANRGTIDVEINAQNFASVWQSGTVGTGATEQNSTPTARPTPSTRLKSSPSPSPSGTQAKPSPSPAKSPSKSPAPKPSPR